MEVASLLRRASPFRYMPHNSQLGRGRAYLGVSRSCCVGQCVCVCVPMCAPMHAHLCVGPCAPTCVCAPMCVCVCLCVSQRACVCVHSYSLCVHMLPCVCACVYADVCVFRCMPPAAARICLRVYAIDIFVHSVYIFYNIYIYIYVL